jgi:phenylalanyl-tRNA synthetase beta chain
MKISLDWLSDFLPIGPNHPAIDPARAADALTNSGLPVETIENGEIGAVMDVEVTSNRSDCLSHVGVARELSVLLDRPFKDVAIAVAESSEPIAGKIAVAIEAADLCPHYTARLIRGVKVAPSPGWMSQRLEAVGIRPINNVVDVTNYVMFEMGQPLHAFNMSQIRFERIIVRQAKPGETILSIDGRKRDLTAGMLVIADGVRPVAIAGVMGGQESEVNEFTTDILLESARFDPLSVRRTARALAMKSDSSYRFERGIDPTLPRRAANRAAELILKTAGGELLAGIAEAGAESYSPKQLSLRLPRVKQILGVELPTDKIVRVFEALGLSPQPHADRIDVTVPSLRLDISQEIDLIEEAARTIGYDQIPTRPEISITLTPPDKTSQTTEAICRTLTAGGYFEAITFSFVSDSLATAFGQSHLRAEHAVRKADAGLRPSLLPGLLEAIARNQANGSADAKLFEIGSIFAVENGKVNEKRTVACAGGDLHHVRGIVEAALGRLDSTKSVRVEPDHRQGFARGAGGRVLWDGKPIGFIGKIDRSIAEGLSLRHLPAAAELDMDPLLAGHRHVPQLRELPRFPSVRRDLSLDVAENVPFEKIQSLVQSLNLPFLETIDFVTTYRGKPLAAGIKSVTITLVFRSPSATLTSEEVEASVQRAIQSAAQNLAATIRA